MPNAMLRVSRAAILVARSDDEARQRIERPLLRERQHRLIHHPERRLAGDRLAGIVGEPQRDLDLLARARLRRIFEQRPSTMFFTGVTVTHLVAAIVTGLPWSNGASDRSRCWAGARA